MRYLILMVVICFLFSCGNAPDYPIGPVLKFVSVNPTTVNEFQDSVALTVSFTDGDGDLGSDDSLNTYVTDSRTTFAYQYKIPFIPQRGSTKSISGDFTLTLPGLTCIPGRTKDSVYYSIKVKDRAGHESNSVSSPLINILCQ